MEESKSKSQKKREADALQELGVKLIELSKERLAALPLSAPLFQAVLEAKNIKSHGAKKRQAQLIGKLMRAADGEAIALAYEQLLAEDKSQTVLFHELEQWRYRLLHEGNKALTEFIEQYQPEDITKLRQLIKKAIEEEQKGQSLGAAKALFRFLRSCV